MTSEILFEQRGSAGFVTLNRPRALNALSHGMVKALAGKLEVWADDPSIAHVVVKGVGGKAFCAGGDIRNVYDARMSGQTDGLSTFFADEYILNARIKAYPKPYVALIDGIVMGGGVGVSVHGSHRIGTEKTLFSMPETAIGFFPDVGGTYFLPRMPWNSGIYCAVSAGRIKQGDALATGVLTHTVTSEELAELEGILETAVDIDAAIAPYLVKTEPGLISQNRELIETAFAGQDIQGILRVLEATEDDFAKKTAETIRAKSPTSVLLAFEQMKRGGSLTFNACMQLEYRIVSRILKGKDFFEGIRAVLVDKDHAPQWTPGSLDQVDSSDLAAYFEVPQGGDLDLPA